MQLKKSPSLNDPGLYEDLRGAGASKGKAARISNAPARKGHLALARKGDKAGPYEDWTVGELKDTAKDIGLQGYSSKRKQELIDVLRNS